MSTTRINRTPTTVRAYGDVTVTIESGQPWPGVYRGSKYTIRGNGHGHGSGSGSGSGSRRDVGLYLNHALVELEGTLPDGLVEALSELGKADGIGLGTVRVTANREVLTKIRANHYSNVEEAFVNEGWIPVYIGKLSGEIEFRHVDNNPDRSKLDPPCVWEGLPFRHGERWTVPVSGGPEWRIKLQQSFQFPSPFDHTDLTRTFRAFRSSGGRFRVNEHGHVWIELPNRDVQQYAQISDKVDQWYQEARERGRNQLLQLIHRRLEATGKGNPKDGLFPIYIGHISEYDQGDIPTPIINDETYYVCEGQSDR